MWFWVTVILAVLLGIGGWMAAKKEGRGLLARMWFASTCAAMVVVISMVIAFVV